MNGLSTLRRSLSLIVIAVGVSAASAQTPNTVEFNKHIRPILSDNCFACHGPDQNARKEDLRLDIEDGHRGKDKKILVSGKPMESELYLRIIGKSDGQRMPPAKFGKQLTAQQVELVKKWIEQGAKWEKHWSLLPVKKQELPAVKDSKWGKHPVDAFILSRLDAEGLKPSSEADRLTLARRLAFDLTGLPPTPEQVDAFMKNDSPAAYEAFVDELLKSPHYGERMALYWLDLVRYADTAGYHSDNHRDIALYRDWVIKAFNENKRFDAFTIEQLAGDLLENPTRDQRVASGYNRLLMTTEEGGAQAKEYLAKYAADRVRNVSVVWLGLTMGCAECHDHKFDPIAQKDFYRFASFFADVQETAVGRQTQTKLTTPEQDLLIKELDSKMAPLQKTLTTATPELDKAQQEWEAKLDDKARAALPRPIVAIVAIESTKRTPQQKAALAAHYRTIAPTLDAIRKEVAALQKQKDAVLKDVPSTLVTTPVPPRMMRVLPRGNWLDDSGEVVAPGIPASVAPVLETKEKRATRLDLAKWMLHKDNPLTARVFVNRVWKILYGQGLVRTLDDFGSQGTWPTHPELLDWLANDFRENGWDVKRLIKQIVLSTSYRQGSTVSNELKQRDPYNYLLARQARYRLDAEAVRDNALAISGLLNAQIGGPSVKPYQPAGYWAMLNFPTREWQNDTGGSLYRRGLYTYWCRTFPHPSLLAFDAPSREECTVERPRSNTPLQALVLLNDPIYVEAARVFAEKTIKEGGKTTETRLQFAFRQALQRKATADEVKILTALYEKHLTQYQGDAASAAKILGVGAWQTNKEIAVAELAAWTSVTRVILNLHETITRN